MTDVTSLITTVYDIATDQETRESLKSQFAAIKTQIGDDPKAFVPILGEVVLTVLTNNSSEDWATTVDSNADTGERSHLATRGTGNAIVNAMAGVAIVKNLPEIGDKLGDAIKGVKKAVKTFVENPFDELGKLKKNVSYRQGEFGYLTETDHLGRIDFAETKDLQLSITERLKHNPNTPGKLEGDHAGHLFGDRFGGSHELDNLVSQASNVNLSKFKTIENEWARALRRGEKVEVDIKINGAISGAGIMQL